MVLIVVGFAVGAIGLLGGATSKNTRGGGGIIVIGPFPIVFGSDSSITRLLLILAIVLASFLIGFFLLQLIV